MLTTIMQFTDSFTFGTSILRIYSFFFLRRFGPYSGHGLFFHETTR